MALFSALLFTAACGDDDGTIDSEDSGTAPERDAGDELADAASEMDAALPIDAGPSLVPVFVAVGDGGWTAVSCDRGRTWNATERSAERGDHTEWTSFGGVASGAETFVAAFGWGAAGHVLTSTDGGASWVEPDTAQFETSGGSALRSGIGAVASDGRELILFTRGIWTSPDGLTWTATERRLPPSTHQTRQLRGFPEEGAVVLSGEAQRENDDRPIGNFVALSEDGGRTWREGTGYDTTCSAPIQHRGDIEMRGDVVLVGAQRLCRSPDRGMTWEPMDSPASGDVQDLHRDASAFYLVGRRDTTLYRSMDGSEWTGVADLGLEPHRSAFGDGVHVVVGSRDDARAFAYSDDGETFVPATFETDLEPTAVRDLTFGYAATSACD